MRQEERFSFVAIKGFGDFVITAACLNRVIGIGSAPIEILIGSHLVELADAIRPAARTRVMPLRYGGVPAINEIRRSSLVRVVESTMELSRLLRQMTANSPATLVFDRLSYKEKIISFGRSAVALPSTSENIYTAHVDFLERSGFALEPQHGLNKMSGRNVAIFPGSRHVIKQLPEPLLKEVVKSCLSAGLRPELKLLDGERPDLEGTDLPHTVVPRRFEAMRAAAAEADLVVSADSMAAHVSEYYRKPTFVFTDSAAKRYWVPLSSLHAAGWCPMGDAERSARFRAFLKEAGALG